MKSIAYAIVCTCCLALSAIPSLVPSGEDRLGLAIGGFVAFVFLVASKEQSNG